MFALALLLVLMASFFHGWYAWHTSVPPIHRAAGFHAAGGLVLAISFLFLIFGLGVIWSEISGLSAALAALAYFFVLPILTVPLLRGAGFIGEPLRCHKCGVLVKNPSYWKLDDENIGIIHYFCVQCAPRSSPPIRKPEPEREHQEKVLAQPRDKITIAELAAECSVKNQVVLAELKRMGLYVFSPTATIDFSFAETIRKRIQSKRYSEAEKEEQNKRQFEGKSPSSLGRSGEAAANDSEWAYCWHCKKIWEPGALVCGICGQELEVDACPTEQSESPKDPMESPIDSEDKAGTCPRCGSPTKVRRSKKTGELYFGCINYPKCRFKGCRSH